MFPHVALVAMDFREFGYFIFLYAANAEESLPRHCLAACRADFLI